jgi:ubiquinone/menaquinone biosynthesis C-methylase UbiE
MNAAHMELCSSAEWAEKIEKSLVPWATEGLEFGDNMLEIGSGPGMTTNILQHKAPNLTCVELDAGMAANLKQRFADVPHVKVIQGSAADLPFAENTFSSAACFTMMHHVPTAELQDKVMSELARVLRPGGILFGTDSLDSPAWRELHVGDICNPLNPLTLERRLRAAGFSEADLTIWSIGIKFIARK